MKLVDKSFRQGDHERNWGRRYLPNFPEQQCPFRIIDRFPEKHQPRYAPPEEDFWAVYEAASGQDRVMLLLPRLFLAARRGEVFRLKWADIDSAFAPPGIGPSRVHAGCRSRARPQLPGRYAPVSVPTRAAAWRFG